jgi:cytosine/adenosine deaminase-related metal-dependent hydrolase
MRVRRYRADWLLPIVDEPVRDGWVALENGRIVDTGNGPAAGTIELGHAAILPALVNVHTHLELSYLHGRIPPEDRFSTWIRAVMARRRQHPDPAAVDLVDAARAAIDHAHACGTGLIGDVSNTLISVPLLSESRMAAHVFYELLGFNAADARARVQAARERVDGLITGANVRVGLAPHAPYSVAPPMFAAIRADLDARPNQVSSVHLGESAEEAEFVRHGTGELRAMLEELGVWTDAWRDVLPSATSPVGYLLKIGFLDGCVMVVHGVQFDGEDLTRLAALGVTIASCPRSNAYVGAGAPPLEAFYAMDVDVAFGTDSLASVADLNVFSELKEARRLAPRVPARTLLESATLAGARALRFEREFGSIETGKKGALIAVRVPEDVVDVEEYLLSGIEPEDIQWLDAG